MLLTIFTPTYNRKELLGRLYKSLCHQTSKDFIWLIVDDGSDDGTREYIEGLKAVSPFRIDYFYQENGGKMRAHNTGVNVCRTELFLCVDSDDYLVPEAVSAVCGLWNKKGNINGNVKDERLSGIVAYKGLSADEKFPGGDFPDLQVKRGRSTLRALYLNGFHGETTLAFRTDILREHPFPEIMGEKYVPEDYVYDQIDEKYELIVFPSIITVCELKKGGYTDVAKKLRRENPTGWYLYYVQRAQKTGFSVLKIKYISHYLRFCEILGRSPFVDGVLSIPEMLLGLPGYFALKLFGKT